eukprot:11180560-Lingulodinium_polyedra.AAC.1
MASIWCSCLHVGGRAGSMFALPYTMRAMWWPPWFDPPGMPHAFFVAPGVASAGSGPSQRRMAPCLA